MGTVVYLLNPTSNHNLARSCRKSNVLYIFWILHQTTTIYTFVTDTVKLYIFWILHQTTTTHFFWSRMHRCISFESYIKPQQYLQRRRTSLVVYLLNPTSNHNCFWIFYSFWLLYIFWILHQTTTERPSVLILACCISFESYIKPQHKRVSNHLSKCCISFESYIKPQPLCGFFVLLGVVYLLNPTSNHNVFGFMVFSFALYIFWILHQTTTPSLSRVRAAWLYIFWILHQTTTMGGRLVRVPLLYIFWILHQTTTYVRLLILSRSCISFESYIKPQLFFAVFWK